MTLRVPGPYVPTRKKKVDALETCLKLFKHLLPGDRHPGSAHIWHGDLDAGNIFVDPANPTQFVGLVDWQSTELAPLHFQARQPRFTNHERTATHGLESRVLPPDFTQLNAEERGSPSSVPLTVSLRIIQKDRV